MMIDNLCDQVFYVLMFFFRQLEPYMNEEFLKKAFQMMGEEVISIKVRSGLVARTRLFE